MDFGISYNTAMFMPDRDKLMIIDKINSIQRKYSKLKKEKQQNENKIKELEQTIQKLNQNQTLVPVQNSVVTIITEATAKGELLCKPFQNYDNTDLYNVFNKTYEELNKIYIKPTIFKEDDVHKYNKELGIDYDVRKDVYNEVPSMTMADLKNFQQKYLKDKRFITLVVGKKKDLDIKTLEQFGEVKYLRLQEIFGY